MMKVSGTQSVLSVEYFTLNCLTIYNINLMKYYNNSSTILDTTEAQYCTSVFLKVNLDINIKRF